MQNPISHVWKIFNYHAYLAFFLKKSNSKANDYLTIKLKLMNSVNRSPLKNELVKNFNNFKEG